MSEMLRRTQELHERAIGQLRRDLAETHDAFAREREKAGAAERRADAAQRHLSALREAVAPLRLTLWAHKESGEAPDFTKLGELLWLVRDSLLAAHDAAPAAQGRVERITFKSATPPGVVYTPDAATSGPAAPAAPTLTLEEVAPVLTEVLEEMLPRHFSTARRRQIVALLKQRLAQKGACRG